MIRRRGLLAGLVSALAVPAIIRTPGLLMPVRVAPLAVRTVIRTVIVRYVPVPPMKTIIGMAAEYDWIEYDGRKLTIIRPDNVSPRAIPA